MAERIEPGDVIEYPFGATRIIETVTVMAVHYYESGAAAIRFRFFPKGIDWHGFIPAGDPDVRIVGRDEATDRSVRSMLP